MNKNLSLLTISQVFGFTANIISVYSEVEEESRFYLNDEDPEVAFQCSK